MKQDIKKYRDGIYQIDVFMENKPGRMSCYYIESSNPILIEVGPSNSFPYLISSLKSLGIEKVDRVIRVAVKEIRTASRNTQGVRIIKLSGDEKVVSAIKIDDNLI